MSKPGNALSKLRNKLPSTSALLSLSAIGMVVFMVGLPSLRTFAIRQNEIDAVRVITALGTAALEAENQDARAIASLLEQNPSLEHRFGDLESLEEFGLLRAHGYLFELVAVNGQPTLTAWPWAFERTGRSAFRFGSGGQIFENANSRGLWSGCRPSDSARSVTGWTELR